MDCCEKKSWKPGALLALAGLAAVAGVALFGWWSGDTETAPAAPAKTTWLEDRPPKRPRLGDVEHGRLLYEMHCASCHGVRADGDGPAAEYLWPLPRDHRDAAYMLSRTDELLFKAVAHGGRSVSRSYLMPAWNDVFDRFETWNLVAYLRSLTPERPDETERATFHQVLLSPERREKIKALGLPRRVGFNRLLKLDEVDEEVVAGYAAFPRIPIGEVETTLDLLLDREGALVRARTMERVRVVGAPPDAVDRLVGAEASHDALPQAPELATRLIGFVDAARRLMRLLLDQEEEDRKAAEAAYVTFNKQPETLSPGARLYMQSCAACHGFTGRVVGPMVMERDAWPRALADGSVMSRLSDGYLKSLIRKGGLHWNLSGAMPASPTLKDGQIDELVAYLRELSDTPADGRCPCAAVGKVCDHGASGKACGCADPKRAGHLCSMMKR